MVNNSSSHVTIGIETSCDDTAVGVYDRDKGLLAHSRHSQTIHNKFGGVVPELAARDHINAIEPVLFEALDKADLKLTDINAVGYTKGPGLAGSLLVGSSFGRTLAWSLNIPSIGIHHLEAHILAPFLEENVPEFPFLALLISGGHTAIIEVKSLGVYKTLGQSIDDAAGEAFDKTAMALGLGYPGGPKIEKMAQYGNSNAYSLPRPLLNRDNCDFSFSGLKTAVANLIRKEGADEKANIAASFQQAVIDTLTHKTLKALKKTNLNQLVISGGVGANSNIRQRFDELAASHDFSTFYPKLEFCTDNGAMVALTASMRLQNDVKRDLSFGVLPRWPIESLGIT